MKASVIVSAPNLPKAREFADAAFKDFFDVEPFEIVEVDVEPFEIVEESSGSENCVQDIAFKGFQVVSWRCEFVAASRPAAA